MRVLRAELGKLFRFQLMWVLFAVFIGFDIFIIYNEVGHKDYQESLRGVYAVISGEEKSGDHYDLYMQYKADVSGSYDDLDMQAIKQMKEDLSSWYPAGSYKAFIDGNYDKLQKRAEQIKTQGDDSGDFYPGDVFEIHKKLYSILRICIIEALIMMCFSVLYLMDYERLNRTEDLVLSSSIGRKCMQTKWAAGMLGGAAFSVLILSTSLAAFFGFVPMKDLWGTSVSSVMVMESSGMWEYPFITFVRLDLAQELLLNIITALLLTLLFGTFAGSLQFLLNNSYITMLGVSLGFTGLMALPFAVKSASWLKTAVCLNPVTLWSHIGRWFIESNIATSFAWSELLTIAIWSVFAFLNFISGRRYFFRKDI